MKKLVCVSLAVLLLVAPAARATSSSFEKFAIIAGLGLAGAAAANAARSRRTEMVTRRGETSFPEHGEEAWARPGEAIYASYNYDAIQAARTTERAVRQNGYPLPAGTTLFRMINGKFCTQTGKTCFKDEDNDGDFDKVARDPETNKKLDVPYELGEIHFDASNEGFRSELVYQGATDGLMNVAYREFVNDMARPAFTQVISYDLEETTTLAFQTLELEVLEAGNMGIRYRVREVGAGEQVASP